MAREGNVIEHPTADRDAATTWDDKQTARLLIALRDMEDLEARRRAREDAALDAEDILTQAEEANALDPVG